MNGKKSAGFTLIETVIALVLLSFIMVIGYQGLIFGIEQWHKGHERMLFQYDYHQAIGWMRNKLGTVEGFYPFEGDRKSYLFRGDRNAVEFVARYERTRRAGYYVSRVFLDPRDQSLYVSYYLHHPDVAPDPEREPPARVKLLPNVASLSIFYYGRRAGTGNKSWHESWRKEKSLPQLLKLEIETVDGINHESLISVLTSDNV